MAKVREARHYQHPKAPVRRIATAAAFQARASMKTALKALRDEVDLEKVKTLIRHGRHREIAHTAIDWHHFEQVLRHPFERLARAYEAGAELGQRKINGAFAARRRGVRYRKGGPGAVSEESSWTARLLEIEVPEADSAVTEALAILKRQSSVAFWKYSPDQPRDEKGRWVGGGGRQAASSPRIPGGKTADEAFKKGAVASGGVSRKMAASEIESLYHYKDGGYREMNRELIEPGSHPNVRHDIDMMQRAILGASTIEKGGLVYRGSKSDVVGAKNWEALVGSKITFPHFTSTSGNRGFARNFGIRTFFRIYLPKGARAMEYGRAVNHRDAEHEMVLPHGSKFYVKAVRQTNKNPYVKNREVDLVLIKPRGKK